MPTIAFFDAKAYDISSFDALNRQRGEPYAIRYYESKLNAQTANLASGCDAVCAFVNDRIDKAAIHSLYQLGVRVIVMRCAGYSNVDIHAAYQKINVLRVPDYSPHAVAEYAIGLLLAVNRKLHKAYNRTREFNFNIAGLTGVDLFGKTVGVIGTGRIGRAFCSICKGFGMRVLAYDPYPVEGITYVSLNELLSASDVISLHCPLTEESYHLLDEAAFKQMKDGVFLINSSRGALIDAHALVEALNSGKVRAAGLDVYEEEADYFFEDWSSTPIRDDILSLLVSKPNVLLTSHQAFLTEEALSNIAGITLSNLDSFFSGGVLDNEVCYRCEAGKIVENCRKYRKERCF